MKVSELAKKLGVLSIEFGTGDEEVTYCAAIEDGGKGAVTFIGNPQYERFLLTTSATAVFVTEQLAVPAEHPQFPVLLRVKSPYQSFAEALELFAPENEILPAGRNPSAFIDESVTIHATARIGSNASIMRGAEIGANVRIMPGVFIGADVRIGENTHIHPNAVIYHGVEIGKNVVIGAGTVVGSDGFGYVPTGDGSYKKIPQVGIVVIEDDVEIGSNCTIDRATVAETRIRKGAKLDNLIQVAHNVEIGDHSVIAAQTGIAGSTKIGDHNILAGQVGVVGHIQTTSNVIIGAQSGVSKSITKSGTYFGAPAKNHREALKLEGALRSLPELIERVKMLEEEVKKVRI